MSYQGKKSRTTTKRTIEMDNRETSADVTPLGTRDIILEYIRSKIKTSANVKFEYTGIGVLSQKISLE